MFLAVAAVALAWPAVGGAFPAGGITVLPFGATYPAAGGGESVHRGMDIACSAGESVTSPVAGEVTFAGRVPSGTGEGTVIAVSIRSDGDVLTMLPFESVGVERGTTLLAGETVGRVAETGDPSSADAHLHVGLKRNGVYLDPVGLLGTVHSSADAAPQASAPEAQANSAVLDAVPIEAVPAETVPAATGAPAAGVSAVAHASTGVVQGQRAARPDAAHGEPGTVPQALVIRKFTTGGAATHSGMATGVSLAPPHGYERGPRAPAGLPSVLDLVRQFLEALPPIAASPAGLACMVAAFVAVTLVLSLRMIERRIQSNPPVSDRFGSMLQHLRAGDTLCGLTSCSGLLPSQSRGRLAQRR